MGYKERKHQLTWFDLFDRSCVLRCLEVLKYESEERKRAACTGGLSQHVVGGPKNVCLIENSGGVVELTVKTIRIYNLTNPSKLEAIVTYVYW